MTTLRFQRGGETSDIPGLPSEVLEKTSKPKEERPALKVHFFCMYVCMKVDAVYNLILFQLRHIMFTCILHANVRQQLCVVRMYVGCVTVHNLTFSLMRNIGG